MSRRSFGGGPGIARLLITSLLASLLVWWTPDGARAQGDSAVVVEPGDRVRVRASGLEPEGREFVLRAERRDSLFLRVPSEGATVGLGRDDVVRLRVRRRQGTHFREGILVGGGAGLLAYAVYASSDRTEGWWANHAAIGTRTVVPGVVLGGLVGWGLADHEWISADVGSTDQTSGGRVGTPPAPALRIRVALPALP